MLDKVEGVKRQADLVPLDGTAQDDWLSSHFARGQSFLVEWVKAKAGAPAFQVTSDDETMLLTFDARARIVGAGKITDIPNRSVAVLPAGDFHIHLEPGCAAVLSTSRKNLSDEAINEESYRVADKRIPPLEKGWKRRDDSSEIQIFAIDQVKAPASNPRLKMFQSATMSVNWVDYQGPRDRKALSPHFHDDFEQGSLAVEGTFVHHLRVNWGKDANEWRDDVHLEAGSPSILVIPPDLVHTTEGIGPGKHLLIDVFAPPRRDFIAKDWMLNASAYIDPQKG